MNEYYWHPTTIRETFNGIREVDLRASFMSRRRLFIAGEIDMQMANDFMIQMAYLAESKEPVDIFINSTGGMVDAGLVIYDIIQDLQLPVNLICIGLAASMAAVILAGGQPGRRFILPHSKTMVHEPLIGSTIGGSAASISNISKAIIQTKHHLNEILAKHTGHTVAEINKATANSKIMNAEESIAFGLCDKMYSFNDIINTD